MGALLMTTDNITKYNLHIVALQEMRRPGRGRIKHKEITIFYSGCGDNRYKFGVGILINDRLSTNFREYETISKLIYFICFRISGQNTT